MFAAIVMQWIVLAVFLMTMDYQTTDIVGGTCVPYGAYKSHAEQRTMTSLVFSVTYVLPVVMMLFCYCRIVYVLKHKVNLLHCRCCQCALYSFGRIFLVAGIKRYRLS